MKNKIQLDFIYLTSLSVAFLSIIAEDIFICINAHNTERRDAEECFVVQISTW